MLCAHTRLRRVVCAVCSLMLAFLSPSSTVGIAILLACAAAYMPFYLSAAHRRADSYRATTAFWPGWQWIWTNILQMPLAEVWLRDPDTDPSVQRIYCSHPHGVASLHHMGPMMCPPVCAPGKSFERVSPGSSRRELAATILFRIPFIRELALAVGCCDASRPVVDRVLCRGLSIGLMLGGEQEQLLSRRGEHTIFVQKRKGIMKLALRHGVPLVPCYCFGETDLYHQSAFALRSRQWLCSKLGIAVTLAYGRTLLLPFLPIPTRLVHVIGSPLRVEKMAEPTPEAVEELHTRYVAALRALFDEYKARAGYADAALIVK